MLIKSSIKTPAGLQTVHYFDSPHFTVDGKSNQIIASERTGREVEDVKHSIRKHNGEIVEVHMETLVELFKAGRLK